MDALRTSPDPSFDKGGSFGRHEPVLLHEGQMHRTVVDAKTGEKKQLLTCKVSEYNELVDHRATNVISFAGVAGSESENKSFLRGSLSKSGKTVINANTVGKSVGLEKVLIRTWGFNADLAEIEIIQPNKTFYFHVDGKGGFTGKMWNIVRGNAKTTIFWDLFKGQQVGTVPK